MIVDDVLKFIALGILGLIFMLLLLEAVIWIP